ncbi:MAG TPA: winged helix-turn-helix domain-containing protein [Candidatus Sulfotelmatobacter sp.]|jgi:TolB-like protein/DNA-binding winged helix-turn-helix (wHTH) protein|nr:winged helix-turn-helix domain-containing protein [Candidatus Sulfotelmatobacter sp.]
MELPPRAFDTLLVLVESSGRLLEKDTLMRTVWGDTVVEENNLSQVVYLLRKALRDGEDGSRYIETVPKRGYRFVAAVREVEAAETNGNGRDVLASFSVPSSVPADRDSVVSSTAASSPLFESGATEAAVPTLHATRRSGWDRGLTRGLTIVAVVALLAAVGWRRGLFGEAGPGPIRSVAVLPLQNLSNDADQEYFVDGMTDELITDLAQIRELKVVSKTSIMKYKGTRIPLPQIGRELGVDAVVEGSVLRSGDRVRITAQLIRAATDRHIWAAAYDGDLKDVLSLQSRVAEAITDEVKLNLTAEESGRLRRGQAVDPEAFDLYLRGRFALNQRNIPGFQKAIGYFNQAIEKDPNFALAYSGLADSHTLLALYGEGPTATAKAKSAAAKALALDGTLAEAHTSLAAVKILQDWDWTGAEQEFQRALDLNSNFAQAHHWYGNLLLGPEGRHDEAIAELQRAQELDPLCLIISADTGFAYYLAGRYDLAMQAYQRVLATNPNFVPVHFYLSQYYKQTGQYDLWLNETVENDRLSGSSSQGQYMQQLYRQGGFRTVMEEMAKPAGSSRLATSTNLRLDACSSAQANAVLGRNQLALDAMEKCNRDAGLALIYAKVDPVWTNLRPEPRFQALLRRIGLQ